MRMRITRGALALGVLFLGGAAAGGFWFWKTWAKDAPKIARDPISPDPLPASPMAMDLESLVPKGAVVIAGVRNIPSLTQSFKTSNFSKAYSGYVAQATARAAQTYRAPYLNNPLSHSEKSALEILFDKCLVVAIYPPASSLLPVSFTPAAAPQMNMPHSVEPKIPPALLLFRIPAGLTMETLVSHFPLFGHSPAKGFKSRQQHLNVPIFDAALGLLAAVIPSKDGPVFAVASDLESLKSCIALSLGSPQKESAAQTDWVQQAFKRIPADSFLYSLTRDDTLKNLNLSLKDLPSFTDWSVTSFSWNGGLASSGFNHLSPQAGNPYKEWAVAGPANYDIFRLIPPQSLLVVATNSLPPESAAALLQDHIAKIKNLPPDLSAVAKKYAAALAGQLDEQAVLVYNGFHAEGGETAHDAVAILQLRSRLKARLALWQASRELAKGQEGLTFEETRSDDLGAEFSLGFKSAEGSPLKLYFALRDRWLIAASRKESLEKAIRAAGRDAKEIGSGMFPENLPERSNFAIFADAYGIYKNILSSLPQSAPLAGRVSSVLDLFSGFLRGGTVFVNASEGIYSQSRYPYQDLSPEAWDSKLASFQENIASWAVVNIGLDLSQKTLQAESAVASALRQYKVKFRKYPATMNELSPRYLPSIPEDPFTGSTKSHRVQNGKGGWFYNPHTGQAKINRAGH